MKPKEMLDYSWIMPPPGSPLLADLRSLMMSLGVTEIKSRYSGGSLLSAINYMKHTDALTILPHSTIFALRHDKAITALPVEVPHPKRALGLFRRAEAPRAPAVDAFAAHVRVSFEKLRLLIARHERAVIWRA